MKRKLPGDASEALRMIRSAKLRRTRFRRSSCPSNRLQFQLFDHGRNAHDRHHSFEVVTQHRQFDFSGYMLEALQEQAFVIHRYLDSPKRMFGERFPQPQHLRMRAHPGLQTIQYLMMHPAFYSPAIFARGALRAQRATRTLLGRINPNRFAVSRLPARARDHSQLRSLRTYIQVVVGVIDELCAREQSTPLGITQLRHRHIGSDLFIFTCFDYFTTKVTAISYYR